MDAPQDTDTVVPTASSGLAEILLCLTVPSAMLKNTAEAATRSPRPHVITAPIYSVGCQAYNQVEILAKPGCGCAGPGKGEKR